MMILILSTAFISCGKINDDPDPKKDDQAGLKDSILIEVTIKTPVAVVFDRIDFMVINSSIVNGGVAQGVTPANVFTIKITGKDATTLIGKESRVGLNLSGGASGHGCIFKLLNGDADGVIPITLKKGMNKVIFEYELYCN